ncbi:response regulator [Aquabacterium sp. A7-Y]|uniref:response regulator n=1 Tax=Aquabacterium sp. A7-Y TaxID=1349605 RepID=UPI00223E01D9|nr:response regulator [Aquabacterium sp. A7-Y]MCW7540850.1 response regulator [Aquabacterium sp. A7-Y]
MDEVPKQAGRILVADDDLASALLTETVLQSGGHEVVVVNNGSDALAAVEGGQFDLAFMDYHMPRMSGVDAARAIRAREARLGLRRLPLVALTASAMPDETLLCTEAGMDEVLVKPFDLSELLRAAARWIEAGAQG